MALQREERSQRPKVPAHNVLLVLKARVTETLGKANGPNNGWKNPLHHLQHIVIVIVIVTLLNVWIGNSGGRSSLSISICLQITSISAVKTFSVCCWLKAQTLSCLHKMAGIWGKWEMNNIHSHLCLFCDAFRILTFSPHFWWNSRPCWSHPASIFTRRPISPRIQVKLTDQRLSGFFAF